MTVGGTVESVGENREFNVVDASDVTIYFTGGDDVLNPKTSSDDTATEKYTNNHTSVKVFALRNDKTVQIVSINGIVFSEPITSIINKGITEKLDASVIFKMVIRTTVADTNIKLRVR